MKRIGDHFDGKLLRDLDSLHFVMPIIYPKRCDNEAYISDTVDLTAAMAFIEKKNSENTGYHYNVFQLMVTAVLKTLMLRPKMNRFIVNSSMYQRNRLSAAFAVKREFKDSGKEGLAFIYAERGDTIDTIHDKIYAQIHEARYGGGGDATEMMDIFNKMPRFISKNIIRFVRHLDSKGHIPQFLIKGDPYYASVVLSNLGSIGMKAGYHHLMNWGTNSVFVAMGEIKKRPLVDENGEQHIRMSLDLGLTIDERIADGYYYSKTVKLLKYLIEHPEELDNRLDERPGRSRNKV